MALLPLLLLVAILLLSALFITFLVGARHTNFLTSRDNYPNLSFDSQSFYRPIRSLRLAIIQTVESSDDPAVQAMSGSVIAELDAAHDRVVNALHTRDDLRKAIEGNDAARSDMNRLQKQRDLAESPEEQMSLTKAYEAKSAEIAEYDRAKGLIARIEHEIELTKASLTELKSKLTVSDVVAKAANRADDLRSTLGNLETIQSSVDEAKEMLRP